MSTLRARRGGVPRARRLAVALGAAAMLVGCSIDKPGPDDARTGEVYAMVVRWYVDDVTDIAPTDTVAADDLLTVFIEPRGDGARIDLQVQADLIAELDGIADVRFIDARDEAIDKGSDDGEPVVRDGGILLRLDPVPEDGEQIEVDVERWIDDDTFETLRFGLVERSGTWRIDGAPDPVTPG